MATYMDVERILYKAGTSHSPLCYLYFCRHCLKLRSSGCVSHEVDALYCPNCLENMTSVEAKVRKNRCMACYDCPSCLHTMSVRATTVSATDSDGQMTPRKAYYLACGFCRWTSRDIGLSDQPVASGGWSALENVYDKRIATLTTYYRQLAQCEKAEKEKKKSSRRKSYMQLSDKYGLSVVAARKRSGIAGSVRDMASLKIEDVEPSIASESVIDDLPDDIFTKPLNLGQVTTISQRHSSSEQQPSSINSIYPQHKHLLIKQSLRCRECEHNLCKHDYNPSSIKFKIQLVALHHVPELRILSLPNLKLEQPSKVIFTICNPCDFITHVTLLPCDPATDKWSTANALMNGKNIWFLASVPHQRPGVVDYLLRVTGPCPIGCQIIDQSLLSSIELPQCELVLARCDATAEFDDTVDQQQIFDDDPAVVVFRKANKIGFCVTVTPRRQGDVKVSFRMKHDYHNIVSSSSSSSGVAGDKASSNDPVWLEHEICVNIGSLSEE